MADNFASVDDYIARFPEDIQVILEAVRRAIHRAVPDSGEKISYQIPTVTMDGTSLIYFAGWKTHIGIYPVPQADPDLEQRIAPYRGTKDTLRFPLKGPMPYDLIEAIAAYLVRARGRPR